MPRTLSAADIAAFRDRLCEAAARLIAERGHADFTLREVARALDVSPMTPYRYFRDKDAMLAALRARAFDRFAAALEEAYRGGARQADAGPTGEIAARADAAGRAYVRFALADPVGYKLMFDVTQPDEADYPELVEAAERARRTMTRHIDPLVEAGVLEGDPVLIGHVYWTVLHGAVMLRLANKLGPDYGLERIVMAAFAALDIGFRPRPEA